MIIPADSDDSDSDQFGYAHHASDPEEDFSDASDGSDHDEQERQDTKAVLITTAHLASTLNSTTPAQVLTITAPSEACNLDQVAWGLDTMAEVHTSGFIDDFVPGSLQPCNTLLQGIAPGHMTPTQLGVIRL